MPEAGKRQHAEAGDQHQRSDPDRRPASRNASRRASRPAARAGAAYLPRKCTVSSVRMPSVIAATTDDVSPISPTEIPDAEGDARGQQGRDHAQQAERERAQVQDHQQRDQRHRQHLAGDHDDDVALADVGEHQRGAGARHAHRRRHVLPHPCLRPRLERSACWLETLRSVAVSRSADRSTPSRSIRSTPCGNDSS